MYILKMLWEREKSSTCEHRQTSCGGSGRDSGSGSDICVKEKKTAES